MAPQIPGQAEIVSSLHRAALDPRGWGDVFSGIRGRLDGSKLSLHGHDRRTGAIFLSGASGYEPEFAEGYLSYYHSINPFVPKSELLPLGVARQSNADIPPEDLFRSEFYNDWMRPQEDLVGAVAIRTRPVGSRSWVLSLNIRRRDWSRLEGRALRLLDALEPHLSHAFQVSEVMNRLTGQIVAATADALQPGMSGGVIVTDHNRYVLWADDGAIRLHPSLLRIDVLGRLRFGDDRAEEWAEATLRQNGKLSGRAPLGVTFTQGSQKWDIRAVKILDPNQPVPQFPGGQQNSWASSERTVFLISRRSGIAPPEQALAQAFGLSMAEAEIALAIWDGASTSEIVDQRKTSLNTVRNQIRAVLHKMDARHRADLVRIVAHCLGSRRIATALAAQARGEMH